MIDISGLSKAEVLAALYNAAAPQGIGFVRAALSPAEEEMTVQEAARLLKAHTTFDYLHGRSFKVTLDSDQFEPWLYDHDNGGDGTAERIIERLRATGAVSSTASTEHREAMTNEHAYQAPSYAEAGQMLEESIAEFQALWQEIVNAGIPEPSPNLSPRQHLDWSSDQALLYFDKGERSKAVMLFLALVTMHPNTAWIATHPMTPMLMQVGLTGDRYKMEYQMKGFAA